LATVTTVGAHVIFVTTRRRSFGAAAIWTGRFTTRLVILV
jgi:hypothetical protein